jgi:hypothetical protein
MTTVDKRREANVRQAQIEDPLEQDAIDTAAISGFVLDVNQGKAGVDLPEWMTAQCRRIVFVEGNVPESRWLAAGAAPGTLAIVLNPDGDGLAEIAAFLLRYSLSQLKSIDIVAHGSDGTIQLGTNRLSSTSMMQHQSELGIIGRALGPDGVIQLYGCEIARDISGVMFLNDLATATGVSNVAASSHLVGAVNGGGSWNLDVQTKPFNIVTPFTAATEAQYQGELLTPSTLKLYAAFNNGAGHPDAFATDIRIQAMQVAGTIAATNTVDVGDATKNAFSSSDGLLGLVVDAPLGVYFVVNDDFDTHNNIMSGTLSGISSTATVLAGTSGFSTDGTHFPNGIALGPDNNQLYFVSSNFDGTSGTGGLYEISLSTGAVKAVATSTGVQNPIGLAIDQSANLAFFIDDYAWFGNGFGKVGLDAVNLASGSPTVQTLNLGSAASLFGASAGWLTGIAVDSASKTVYFTAAKSGGTTGIGIYSASYSVTAGTVSLGSVSTLYANQSTVNPYDIAIDPVGGVFYVSSYHSPSGGTGPVSIYEGSLSGQTAQPSLAQVYALNSGDFPVGGGIALLSTPTLSANIVTTPTLLHLGTAVAADSHMLLLNQDGNGLKTSTVTITGGFQAGDSLIATGTAFNGIAVSGSASSITLTATAVSLANWQNALDNIGFNATAGVNTLRTLTWQANDGINSSTAITTTVNVICFCVGTLIRTPDGEVQVEKLRIGDTVSTLLGGPQKVRWIGKGKVLATRGQRSAATPVIVCKGALADNVPNQDLRVTKAHSLYIDSVLIPVEFLVNHKTILWDDRAQEVEIYHVALDRHDVLWANGALAESYRDDGNRWLFQNANEGWNLERQQACAPVLTGGPLVDGIWHRLLERAGPRSLPPLTDDPALHLIVDGNRVDAVRIEGRTWVFYLACQSGSILIVSREAVPSELGLARDPRSLGVALERVVLRKGLQTTTLPAEDCRLSNGFHGYEHVGKLRWTNGRATLPREAFEPFTDDVEVTLILAATTWYPEDGLANAHWAA